MNVTHIFFDIGGVLGTGGWDTGQRALAVERFDLDARDFEQRHQEAVGTLEVGRMSLDEYLDVTVFDTPRSFSRDEFRQFMLEQSQPFPETIAIARALADTGRYRLMTINNESAELNVHRIRHFGLRNIFSTFFSSCWAGVSKPSRRIYELALTMCQAYPEQSVFIDDRDQNLPPARILGMHTILYTSADLLTADLAALGITTERGDR
ncbi:MAG: HAD-IA family hydrolase [Gemmatimonadaceae bacterium]